MGGSNVFANAKLVEDVLALWVQKVKKKLKIFQLFCTSSFLKTARDYLFEFLASRGTNVPGLCRRVQIDPV